MTSQRPIPGSTRTRASRACAIAAAALAAAALPSTAAAAPGSGAGTLVWVLVAVGAAVLVYTVVRLRGGIRRATHTSSDIADGQPLSLPQVSGIFGAGGEDVSPQLSWSGFPAETKSFAVTCYDPDAPTGSGFWHWLQLGFPATTTEVPRGAGSSVALEPGTFCVRNDFSEADYGGAAPPAGDRTHRYIFAVHALDVEQLALDAAVSAAYVGFNLFFHTVARATLTAHVTPPAS